MIPSSIQRYLDDHGAVYREIRHLRTDSLAQAAEAAAVPGNQLVRAVALVDARGLVMAILGHDRLLDFSALCQRLGRDLEPIPAARTYTIFHDCEPNCCPPFPVAYGLEAVVDRGLLEQPQLFLEPGSHNTLLAMDPAEFLRLNPGALAADIGVPLDALQQSDPEHGLGQQIERLTPARIRRSLESFHDLPPLPATALQILELSRNPNAGAFELARVIEQDAPLAARVMRYANSPLYGFPGKIRDIKSAIARVLGFDFVMNLALGIAVGHTLRIPADGPLGLNAFWRHSVYCATLAERLAREIPNDLAVRRGTAYLAGLLHNIGILLLGEAFQAEFFLLNRYLLANPHLDLPQLEQHALGVSHAQVGGWLMTAWGLPGELHAAACHHHDPDFWGDHALYAQLVLIANRALAAEGIGFDDREEIPRFSLEMLGLSARRVGEITAELVAEEASELDELARQVA